MSITVEKACQQEHEAARHTVSSVKKQNEMNIDAQLIFSF